MKTVAIIRFSPTEGPGHLAEFLDAAEIAAAAGTPSVQPVAAILSGLEARVAVLNRLANSVYTRWTAGLK